MASDSIPLLQLMQTKGVGARSLARVLDRLQRDQVTLREFVALDPEEIVDQFGLTADQARSIGASEETATQMAEMLESKNVRSVLLGSPAYPSRLTSILGDKAPAVLFLAGRQRAHPL